MPNRFEYAAIESKMHVLGDVGLFVCSNLLLTFRSLFYVAVWAAFLRDFCDLVPPKGVPVGFHFHAFCKFYMQQIMLELRLDE